MRCKCKACKPKAFIVVIIMFVLVLAVCTCTDTNRRPPAETDSAPDTSATETQQPETISAAMRVVTLAGAPLTGMTPIATLTPNAFDKPVATGLPTDANGESRIRFPADQKVTLRAWDSSLLYFPNNFYEVLPGTGAVRDTLVVSMVRSSAIEAVLINPDGELALNENVGLMLFHPVHGPWWPAEADTDDEGTVVFYRVPPGEYVIRIKIASGAMTDVPETYIAPGETTHIGQVYFE